MSDVHRHSEGQELQEKSLNIPCPSGPPIPAILTTLTTPPATPNTAVILCHGFLSDKHSRTNRRLTELLVPKGIATLRFDWYGMGELREHFFHLSLSRCLDQLTTLLAFLQAQGVSLDRHGRIQLWRVHGHPGSRTIPLHSRPSG
jgi:alpha-beta hydrolase superfamily lysophospholipase